MGGAPRRRRWAEGRGAALTGAARACRAAPSSARPTAGSTARSAAGVRSSRAGGVARARHAGGLAAALAPPCRLEQ
jgi:hypothetical protein